LVIQLKPHAAILRWLYLGITDWLRIGKTNVPGRSSHLYSPASSTGNSIEIAVADESAKDPLANQHLHPPGIVLRKRRLLELHRLVVSLPRFEYSVDDAAREMVEAGMV